MLEQITQAEPQGGDRISTAVIPFRDKKVPPQNKPDQQSVQAVHEDLEHFATSLDTKDLDYLDTAKLGACKILLDSDRGTNTPFESFFDSLLLNYMHHGLPTPAEVAKLLEEFREDFDSMMEESKDFLKSYAGRK